MTFNSLVRAPLLKDLAALIAGGLLTLAFAPFSCYPLAIAAPALLLFLWLPASPKRAFWLGWLFGLSLFGTGVSWVYISMHSFGHLDWWAAGTITAGFIAILALFPAWTGFLLNRYFKANIYTKLIYAFPLIWVFLEWVRTWILSGFPWLFIGTSQVHSPLRGFAPLIGVYGVSLVALMSSGFLVNIYLTWQQKQYKQLAWSLVTLLILWFGSGGYYHFHHWTTPYGKPIKVSLIQGNIPQDLKWSAAAVDYSLEHYRSLTQAHWDSQIIIWPEFAIPLPLQAAWDFVKPLGQAAKSHHATLLTGVPIYHPTQDHDTYFNAVIAIGSNEGVYVKQRLVPFGEYTPFPSLLKRFMDMLQVPMSNLIPGPAVKLLTVDHIKIAAFICYEIAFPEQVSYRSRDANLLLTVNNDAWFGHSIAQAQHLEIAQMRALELQHPILFLSNTGLTAFITASGAIQSIAPPDVSYVLTDYVQPVSGETPWQQYASDPFMFILLVFLIKAIIAQKKHTKRQIK